MFRDLDEKEQIELKRKIRVIFTEICMFVAVIFLAGFLTLIVMGYSFHLTKIGKEGGEVIERTGLVQISSSPTGATITIDGGTPLLLRTNASRTLQAGEHTIVLSRDGYETWAKKVKITEGMMYRVNYPKLFLAERTEEKALEFGTVEFMTVTPNGERMIIKDGTEFFLVELNAAKPTRKAILFSEELGAAEKIEEIEWSGNSKKMLARVDGEIAVFDLEEPERSGMLKSTSEKLAKAGEARFETGSGERVMVLTAGGELVEVDLKTKAVSEALVSGVLQFENSEDKVIYLTEGEGQEGASEERETGVAEAVGETEGEKVVELRVYRIGDEESYRIKTLGKTGEIEVEKVKFSGMKYYQDFYFLVARGEGDVRVYRAGEWPEGDDELEKIFQGKVDFSVMRVLKHGKGMVFGIESEGGREQAVFDIEAEELKQFSIEGENGWVNEFLRFEISPRGEIYVVDYDGENWRRVAEKGAERGLRVVMSGNGKYLYYFRKGGLYRQKVG